MGSTSMTVLLCEPGHVACKVFWEDKVESYNLGWRFQHESYPVEDFNTLERVIRVLAGIPGAVVIRGDAKPDAPEWVRRTYLEKPGRPAHFEGCPKHWFCLDFDDTGIEVIDHDYQTAARKLILRLPQGMREASWVVQVSNSAHRSKTLKCHLWGLFSYPVADGTLREFCKRNGIDPSLANPVQPHFVANPLIVGDDPIAERVFVLPGTNVYAELRMSEAAKVRSIGEERLTKACQKIKRAVSEGLQRHDTLNKQCYSLGKLVPHVLSEHEIKIQINAAIDKCEPERREGLLNEMDRALQDGMRSPEYTQADEWRAELSYAEKGVPLSSEANIQIVLTSAPEFAGRLAWNIRKNAPEWREPPPWPTWPGMTAIQHAGQFTIWVAAQYRMTGVSVRTALHMLEIVSSAYKVDPVVDYLEALEWDGTPRIYQFAATHLGIDSEYGSLAFAQQLITSVRRAYEPGCQADYLLMFRGDGGLGKSTFFRWLGGEFHGTVGAKIGDKDAVVTIQDIWIAEFAEASSFKRQDAEAIKEYLTNPSDNVRLPYAARAEKLPRRCAFFGSMNPPDAGYDDWILDPAHGRRFRVLDITRSIKGEHLTSELRDQLWAEALIAYKRGDSSWELTNPAAQEHLALTQASSESTHDPWLEVLDIPEGWEGKRTGALWDRLHIEPERRSGWLQKRLYRCMRTLGYKLSGMYGDQYCRGKGAVWTKVK